MGQAQHFPLFVNLEGKRVLIVGAGMVAARRASVFVDFGADVTVVAPEESAWWQTPSKMGEASPWTCQTRPVSQLAGSGCLTWHRRRFEPQDLEQTFLVIAATNDAAENDRMAQLCHERGIPVNHAGDQSQCDFQFPAIVKKEPIVIGINAGGKDHGLVKRVAAKLRKWISQEKFCE